MDIGNFVNEVLTYGIISVSSALPVQSCHTDNITMQYNGPTYAISEDYNYWKRKPAPVSNTKEILFGGYSNMEVPKKNKTIAAN